MNKESEAFLVTLSKLRHWCDLRDRSEQDLRKKLSESTLNEDERERIVALLQEEGYQSELRFAESFMSGRIRIKRWGLVKIKHGLRQHGVPDRIIQEAIHSQFDEELYMENLIKVLESKGWRRGQDISFGQTQKLLRFTYQRGYETDRVRKLLGA